MKKIYIRAGMSPLEPVTIADAIHSNRIAYNSGNLLYQYSVMRALFRPDVPMDVRPIEPIYRSADGIDRLNAECSCAVFPLANAFRSGFNLKLLTDAIKRLKIPCVVVGCGLQAASADLIEQGFPFDDDVRAFVSAVLDKSAMIGLRGEYTAEYLKRLGFVPERHFTVIGCPALFLNGPQLPSPRLTPISADTRMSINLRRIQPAALNALMVRTKRDYPDYHLVLQEQRGLSMLAFGTLGGLPYPSRRGLFPWFAGQRDVKQGRVVGFTDVRSWLDYMQNIDYSFGSRLHGNIAAVVSGTPAFVFTSDTRTEEVCRYANIANMPVGALQSGMDIRQVLERADFNAVLRGYSQRFAHFTGFLEANGLRHVYDGASATIPFDEAIRKLAPAGCVRRGGVVGDDIRQYRKAFYSVKLKRLYKRKVNKLRKAIFKA